MKLLGENILFLQTLFDLEKPNNVCTLFILKIFKYVTVSFSLQEKRGSMFGGETGTFPLAHLKMVTF